MTDGKRLAPAMNVPPCYESRWWIHRVDGEPIDDEMYYIDGGTGSEPDWADLDDGHENNDQGEDEPPIEYEAVWLEARQVRRLTPPKPTRSSVGYFLVYGGKTHGFFGNRDTGQRYVDQLLPMFPDAHLRPSIDDPEEPRVTAGE